MYKIRGFLKGEEVLVFNVWANNRQWKKYELHTSVLIDRLEIPAGMDLDNLDMQVDSNSVEKMISE